MQPGGIHWLALVALTRPGSSSCLGGQASGHQLIAREKQQRNLGHSLTLPLQQPLCPYLPGSPSLLSPREDKTLTFLPGHNLQVSLQRKPGSHDSASQGRRPFLSGSCQACWLPGPLWPPFIPFSLFQTEQLGTSVQGSYFLSCSS